MYNIIILLSARQDIINAAKWYNEQSEGLGDRFTGIVVNYIDNLQNDFIKYSVSYKGLSSIFIKRFPYKVYFRKDEEQNVIVVYAVLHNKQNRSILNKRKS